MKGHRVSAAPTAATEPVARKSMSRRVGGATGAASSEGSEGACVIVFLLDREGRPAKSRSHGAISWRVRGHHTAANKREHQYAQFCANVEGRAMSDTTLAEHHSKAAEHHGHAKHHHEEAAKAQEDDDHAKGHHHAHIAHGHHLQAEHHHEVAAKH